MLVSFVGCQDSLALESLEGSCSIGVRPSVVGGSRYRMSPCVPGHFTTKMISVSGRYLGRSRSLVLSQQN